MDLHYLIVKTFIKRLYIQFQTLHIKTTIETISEYAFRGLSDLQELFMSMCQLSAPPPIAPIRRTLRHLYLGGNNMTYIPEDYFTGCQVLHRLELSNNQLAAVPDVQILNATLRNFILHNNMITHVETLYFVPMVMLKTLDLSKNLITEIEFNNVIWPSITTIVLDFNHLKSIKTDLRALGKVLIRVQGNPWHCDVELCYLSHCQYNMGGREAFWSGCPGSWMIQLVGNMVCNSPEELKHIKLKESGKNTNRWSSTILQ